MTSGFPPSLPTTTKTSETAPRGNDGEQRIIYTSHTERERERRGELVHDRPPAVRARWTEGRMGEGKGKGGARRDPASNAALRVHGNECSSYANGASRRNLSSEETALNESREELSPSLVSPAVRFPLENFQENGMETFVR